MDSTATHIKTADRALVIGCSDGIGLALVRRLLAEGWRVVGISRSASPVAHENYSHLVRDVAADGYRSFIGEFSGQSIPFSACIYCAGIGEGFDPANLDSDARVLRVNLLAAMETAAALIPAMVRRREGRFVVLSSLADCLLLPNSPAYAGSKAGLSAYFESLALAVRASGVVVTNLRFGFVSTKMAKSPATPLIRSPDWAAEVIMGALCKNDIRISRPRRMALLVTLLGWLATWRVWLASMRFRRH